MHARIYKAMAYSYMSSWVTTCVYIRITHHDHLLKAEDIDTEKQVSIRATEMILPPTVALKAKEMILPPPVAPTATKLILPPGVMHQ